MADDLLPIEQRGSPLAPAVRSTGFSNVVIFGLGSLTGVFVARALGATGRGTLVIATIAPTFIATFGTVGVEEATVYLAGRANAERRSSVVWTSLVVATLLGLGATAVSVAIQWVVFRSRAKHVSGTAFFLFAVLPVVFAVTQSALATMRAGEHYAAWNLSRLSIPVLYFVTIVALDATHRLTVTTTVLALAAANITLLMGAVIWLVLTCPFAGLSRDDARALLAYGWRNHLITVQNIGNQQLDQLVLAALVPAGEVGRYAVAATYASAGLAIGTAPGLQLFSHVSRSSRLDPRAFARLRRNTLIFLLVVAAVTAALAPFVLPFVFGSSFRGAVLPAVILLAGCAPLAMGALYSAVWKAAGRPLRAAAAEGIGLIVTVVGLALLIPPLGIRGAAIISSVSYTLVAFLLHASRPVQHFEVGRGRREPPPSETRGREAEH